MTRKSYFPPEAELLEWGLYSVFCTSDVDDNEVIANAEDRDPWEIDD